jgi:Na+/H+ antiporter NhaC
VLSGQQQATLLQFVGFFAVMIWGVAVAGWEMSHMSALFIAGAACVGLTNSMSEERFTSTFLDGARDMLGVAILIGLARGIVLVMTDGMITDTLLQWMAQGLQGLPATLFINIAFAVEGALTFLVPSTSGLAALTMPVLAPLADFAGCVSIPNLSPNSPCMGFFSQHMTLLVKTCEPRASVESTLNERNAGTFLEFFNAFPVSRHYSHAEAPCVTPL